MSEFEYEVSLTVRFRDIDAMGHVNNAVYATYLEQARVQFIEDVIGEPLMETGAVVADLHIDFERPIDWGEEVTVAVRAGELGTSSIPLEYEIHADGDVAATAETLMVTFDPEAREPRPMPDAWRERIQEHQGN
ncbi:MULTISPECIES: acyl-CoA thioesterase [Salinibaculum]|uniref:acyl-CoA thioesterase n=1 Tax=Salinibaculum TaxID=2732368 RepID=UPI0030D575E8